jgi:hypothetical protein
MPRRNSIAANYVSFDADTDADRPLKLAVLEDSERQDLLKRLQGSRATGTQCGVDASCNRGAPVEPIVKRVAD